MRKLLFFDSNMSGTVAKWGLCLQNDGALWRFGPLNGTGVQPMVLLRSNVGDIGVRREDEGPFGTIHDSIYAITRAISGGPAGKLMRISSVTGEDIVVYYTAPGITQVLAFGFDNNFLFVSRNSAPTGDIQRVFAPSLWNLPNPLPGQPTGWVTD